MSSRGIALLQDVIRSGSCPSESQEARRLAERLVAILLGEERWTNEICAQSVAESVWTTVTEGARWNWSADTLKEKLELDHPFCAAIVGVYKEKLHILQTQLRAIGWDYPELVDCECILRNTVQTELLNRVSEPFVSLKLHTLPAEETTSKCLELNLNANQFQDLHSKIKEAMNVLEQLKKK
ncbi:hypothetical protein KIN20_034236 [Parelaphostrongylus tenuis]|uniref:COMM domain-containing protein n=1 Tax=Parelaphostrongylus tenuis TaxID=148309 RepID=A0AAD5WJ27_PARTN|nr:hypothetical protein KIN20_034236 [Parelaphostrongylus tenuis]